MVIIISMSGCFLIVTNSSVFDPDNSIKYLLLGRLIPKALSSFLSPVQGEPVLNANYS